MKDLIEFGGKISKKKEIASGLIGAIVLIILWQLITTINGGIISPKILPSPVNVLKSIPDLVEIGLFKEMWYTISLNLTGYVYAIIIAIPAGFLIGIYPLPRALFRKYIEAIRYLPLPATSGIFIAALGLGFDMKASFLAFGILIYILPVVTQRVLELQDPTNEKDNIYIQTGKTIGMTNWQQFRYIYWPYVMGKVYSDIRSLVAISYTYVTIAESLNKEGGIGAMISTLGRQSRTPEIYALLFIIILIGICQDYGCKKLEPVLFPYKRK
jgi:NitT/TauT family transport system permease protein